jgi:pSer/pThr/pTyr-binding forkhead associated (FHA) protein
MSRRETDAGTHPRLVPLTPEAREASPAPEIPLQEFPFRVGRDLRDPHRRSFRLFRRNRRRGDSPGPNDLYLPEPGPRHRLSREHFLIDREGERFFVVDRRSACGTVVEEDPVGGHREGGKRWLNDGDVITVGGNHSPFVFKFACPVGPGE